MIASVVASTDGGIVRLSAFVDSSSCPSLSPCLAIWREAVKTLSLSEHPARRRATNAQPGHSRARRAFGVSPRTLDRGAILPSPRGSSMCRRSRAGLPYRLVGGVVLRPNPVASSRPSDAYACRRPSLGRRLALGARQSRSSSSGSLLTASGLLYYLIRPRQHRRQDREAEGLGGLEV